MKQCGILDTLEQSSPEVAARLKLAYGRAFTSKTKVFFAKTYGLTAAETDVLVNLCKGASTREIASALNKTEGTVRTQKQRLFIKMHTSSSAQAVSLAFLNIIGTVYADVETIDNLE